MISGLLGIYFALNYGLWPAVSAVLAYTIIRLIVIFGYKLSKK